MTASNLDLRRLLLLAALGLFGCSSSSNLEVVRGGISNFGSGGGGCWFQTGGLYLKKDSPGVLFGMAKEPGGDRQLKYLVVFKHRATARTSVDSPARMSDGQKGKLWQVTMTDGVRLDGKKIELTLELEVDPVNKVVVHEEMTFAGQKIDLSKGRLFLADLRAEPVTWKQVQVALPANPPDPTQTKDVEQLAKRVLTELPKNSEEVRDFVK